MVDVLSRINNLNWDYDLSTKYDHTVEIDTDANMIQNNTDDIGMYLEKDKSEDSRALEYTRDDEKFKALLDKLFDEQEEQQKDEQEGDDEIMNLILLATEAEYKHQQRFDINQIEGENIAPFSSAYQNFDIRDLLDEDGDAQIEL